MLLLGETMSRKKVRKGESCQGKIKRRGHGILTQPRSTEGGGHEEKEEEGSLSPTWNPPLLSASSGDEKKQKGEARKEAHRHIKENNQAPTSLTKTD